MTERIHYARVFRVSALAFFGLVAVAIVLGLPKPQAQEPLEASVATIRKSLLETPDVLESRMATLRSRLDRKRTYLVLLNKRLSKARTGADERVRAHQMSRYSYQVFLVSSRIAAEENKLREAEALMALVPRLGASQAPALIKKELEAAVSVRIETAERLLREAEEYRPSITEPTFKAQFERLFAGIRAERERLKEQR